MPIRKFDPHIVDVAGDLLTGTFTREELAQIGQAGGLDAAHVRVIQGAVWVARAVVVQTRKLEYDEPEA